MRRVVIILKTARINSIILIWSIYKINSCGILSITIRVSSIVCDERFIHSEWFWYKHVWFIHEI